jgi:hypothetical protein
MTLDNYEEEEENEIFYLTIFQHYEQQLNIVDTRGEEENEQLLRLILNIYVYSLHGRRENCYNFR